MKTFNAAQLTKVARRFQINGTIVGVSSFGSGHINDTFRVDTDHAVGDTYLLQRVNHHIFNDVAALMRNMEVVTKHLKDKYRAMGEDPQRRVLTLVRDNAGNSYCQDELGNFWRMFILLADTRSFDIVESAQQAREGGRAFGQFQGLLADLDARLIADVLPNFHHIGKRLERLDQAILRDVAGRLHEVPDELDFVDARRGRMHAIQDKGQAGRLPLRITHNDTKFNNVLLDGNNQFQCVIDLDTVMPGYVACDFGDAIRTIINRAAEDEPVLDRIQLNIPLFEAYADGYLEQARHFITEDEVESLLDGVFLLPYMQTVRFLTDYLEGDHYYKIHHDRHNLQRTRAQRRLVEELEKHETQLRMVLHQAAERHRSV